EIREAFRGVTLGQGTSLGQAQFIDDGQGVHGNPYPPKDKEMTNDWSQVPVAELERDSVAHLDAVGFRYYIPALMLSVLSHYDSTSMRVIGTLTGLYPKRDNLWEYHMQRYSALNEAQKSANRAISCRITEIGRA